MSVDIGYFVAWILPALVGGAIWIALCGPTLRKSDFAAAIGAGWLIGVFVAAICARLAASADTARTFAHTWPWLAAIGVVGMIFAMRRARNARASAFIVAAPAPSPRAVRILWWLLLLWIVARLFVIGDEALLRPVFPWDAWSAWSIKPKTWFLVGHVEAYVSITDWLANSSAHLRTAASWSYPELLAWLQLWFASAAGAWNEPLVDIAWCGGLTAFALAAYGYWRAFGLAPWLAILLVYGLVSLPLIDAHVALAGYADIWIAITLGLVALAWSRWLITGERGQWILALATSLFLPAIKLEGGVWLLAFLAMVVLDLLPRHWRRRSASIVVGLFVLVLLAVAIGLSTGIGAMHIDWNRIDIPSTGSFAFGWHGVGGAMVASLFTLPNWHLLWYLVPVLLLVRRQRFAHDRAARLLGLMLLIDFAFLFVLFFFTAASAWAQDFTSANRLILQLVPSVFVLAAVLLRPLAVKSAAPGPYTAPASVGPIRRS